MKRIKRATLSVAIVLGIGLGGSGAERAWGGGPIETYDDFARAQTGGDPVRRLGMDTWFFWTAGNPGFWGRAFPIVTQGEVDLLRLLDASVIPRAERFKKLGTINDPGCRAADGPDQFGLQLDVITEPMDPTLRGIYGDPTGIVGLRRFPNPGFNLEKWNAAGGATRYLNQTRENYDPTLQPPYLIGMACAVCHVAFNPLHPPADPAEPKWADLAPALGNQYLRESAVFNQRANASEFRWHVGQAQQPGTSDTSRIPDDFLNNPTAINAVFGLAPRLGIGTFEVVSAAQAAFIQGMAPPIPNDLDPGPPPRMHAIHGLMDGADSVGLALGSLRVYANIGGLDFAQFLNDIPSAANGYTQQPFDIVAAKANPNQFWLATEPRMPAMQAFLAGIERMPLSQAPGGKKYLDDPPGIVVRGQIVFARNCASCHSSKQPDPGITNPARRLAALEKLVRSPDFLDDNFLSDDRRYPLTAIQTHASRGLSINATAGGIWQDFSSQTYKDQPSAGRLDGLFNPLSPAQPIAIDLPAGGPGYYRTPTLISIWATAPYLHNNSIGEPTSDPSVEGRMEAFQDGMEKLLWPSKRAGRDAIPVTTSDSVLTDPLGNLIGIPLPNGQTLPVVVPAGTPVDLLANLQPRDLPAVLAAYVQGGPQAAAAEALKHNLCPDFVPDHGHLFGTDLSDPDKRALIAYLKRL